MMIASAAASGESSSIPSDAATTSNSRFSSESHVPPVTDSAPAT